MKCHDCGFQLALGVALVALGSTPLQTLAQAAPGAPPVNNAVKTARSLAALTTSTTTARSAQVQITDDEAHSPYQEGGLTNCTFAGACIFTFSAVPAGHRRLVEHFSCSIYLPAPGALRYVALLSNSFAYPRDFFPTSRSAADSAQSFVNSPTLLSFNEGESPVAYTFADGGPIQELFCTVTGRDITLP